MLLNPRHRHHFDLVKNAGLQHSTACERLVRKSMKREGLTKEDDFFLICEFVDVAVNEDFFMEGFEMLPPEYAFDIKNENPPYHIVGYIDRLGFKGDLCRIEDWKTSKNRFTGEDLRFNIQSLIYQLAVNKLWPKIKKSFVNFLFLKFRKNPRQVVSVSNEKLKGVEHYLSHLTEYLSDFNQSKIESNYGWDNPSKKPLCGKIGLKDDGVTHHWICPEALPRTYYVLTKDGKVISSKNSKDELTQVEGSIIEERKYAGCPKFMRYNSGKLEEAKKLGLM